MKHDDLYVCEYCHTQYSALADAKACEKQHSKNLTISEKIYNSFGHNIDTMPTYITVTDEYGNECRYRRVGIVRSGGALKGCETK